VAWIFLSLLSCNDGRESDSPVKRRDIVSTGPSASIQDSSTWIASLREFRDAVYTGDNKKVRTFFSFPVMNENNEIWDHVLDSGMVMEGIKPFTEKDFDKYYNKLFIKEFVQGLLKVRTDVLYRDHYFATAEFKRDSGYSFQLYARYFPEESILELNVAFRGVIELEEGPEVSEYNVVYQFDVIDEKLIRFRQIRLAG
jgi:hypothetical protein